MKLTKDQIKALLSGMGIAQAVEIVENPEEAEKDFNPTEAINNFIKTREPVFMAKFNEEVLPEKLKAVAGEFGGKLNGFIRKASDNQISVSDLQDLQDNEKIEKLVEVLNKNKGKDAEGLRAQLKEMVEAHNAELETIKQEHQNALTQSEHKLKDYKINDYLQSKIIPKIPLVDGDNKIRTNLLKSALAENYHLEMNGEGELELRQKDKPESPVIDKTTNTIYKPEAYAEQFFKGLGVVKTDNRDTPPAGSGATPPARPNYGYNPNSNKDIESAKSALDSL